MNTPIPRLFCQDIQDVLFCLIVLPFLPTSGNLIDLALLFVKVLNEGNSCELRVDRLCSLFVSTFFSCGWLEKQSLDNLNKNAEHYQSPAKKKAA